MIQNSKLHDRFFRVKNPLDIYPDKLPRGVTENWSVAGINFKESTCGIKEESARLQKKSGSIQERCDDRLMAKVLLTIIQVNLWLNPGERWRRQHTFLP